MSELCAKSKLLTAYLEALIKQKYGVKGNPNQHVEMNNDFSDVHVEIISPADPEQRGAQLSLSFSVPIEHMYTELEKRGVVVGGVRVNCKKELLLKKRKGNERKKKYRKKFAERNEKTQIELNKHYKKKQNKIK